MDQEISQGRASGAVQLLDFGAWFCFTLCNYPVDRHPARDRRGHRTPDQVLAPVYVLRTNVVIDVLVLGTRSNLQVRA